MNLRVASTRLILGFALAGGFVFIACDDDDTTAPTPTGAGATSTGSGTGMRSLIVLSLNSSPSAGIGNLDSGLIRSSAGLTSAYLSWGYR